MCEQHQQQIQQNQHTQNIQLWQQQQQQQQKHSNNKYNLKTKIDPYTQEIAILVSLKKDLYDFFGLRSTKYLQETCKVNLPLRKRARKSKGYTFLNVPDHVYSEIVINGVEFKSKQLVLEEAKTKHKDRTLDKQNPLDHQFKNYYLNIMHQHEQQQRQASSTASASTSSTATTTKRTTYPAITTTSTPMQTIQP